MIEVCPSCHGERVTDVPDRLAAYVHDTRCSLAFAEAETYAADRVRHRRFGTPSRHRPISPAERMLLGASGVPVAAGECFTRVSWHDGVRTRTWRRQPVVAVDEVTP